ncbi:MAG: TlyA family RNA methyltransferase [Deltaproteobacteria bacterium]|nr:TlyA family RNA methyltransferase [Deltaproteobacteria bacterium]
MKVRLDKLLVEKEMADTRSKAVALIMAGDVIVNGRVITKAGTPVDSESSITLKETFPYVGRAALKLEAALDFFKVNPKGKIAIDIGASTGGFVDILLKRGAKRVYAVDVGHSQLHWKLRNHRKVVNLEGINARTLDKTLIPELCDIATFDVSFISLKLVIPPVLEVLRSNSDIIALIKPQFEAGREHVKRGGIVKDEGVILEAISDIKSFLINKGLYVSGVIPSPIKGAKGNQEYLMHAVYKVDI